jgi:hypothetical protein
VKTDFLIPGIDPKLCEDPDEALTAAAATQIDEQIRRAAEQFKRGRTAFRPDNQPRDFHGRFRQVLARLKFDLGDKQLEGIVAKIREAENQDDAGDYAKSAKAATDVVGLVDKIQEGVLDPESIKNVRAGAAELGRVLAYLPLPQGDPNAKVRFSDLPPSTQELIDGMVERVVAKLGVVGATDAVALLNSFKSGVRSMSSDELSAELNKLLRLLT